jgi:hypothetical protein
VSIDNNPRPHGRETQRPSLLDVARGLVAITDLRPAKAEQFIADWWSRWEGAEQESPEAHSDLLNRFTSRYVDYLTTEQQAQFVRNNLPKAVAAYHFQRCIATLVEKCPDESSAELLRNAGDAAELLTSWPLQAVLGDLAGPILNLGHTML